VCFDESHLYTNPELRRMYATVTRNLRKRKLIAGTWYLETTTMFAPGEESVAEATYRLSEQIEAGKTKRERLLVDHRWGLCEDLSDEKALRAGIREAYGDAMAWNDLDGLVNDFYDPRNHVADSRRYFLNAETETSNAWIAAREWDACADVTSVLADGDMIALGFDGSVSEDATALVACRIDDGYLELLVCEEKPDSVTSWQVDQLLVDSAVVAAFEKYNVVAFFADPPHYQDYVDKWTAEFSGRLRVKASQTHPVEWWTNRPATMVKALERFREAVAAKRLIHDGSTLLRRHVLNARRRVSRSGITISKENPSSLRKIDAAMAAVLAYEARADAIASGVTAHQTRTRSKKLVRY
jgi:phage terminase large subunit-like protein